MNYEQQLDTMLDYVDHPVLIVPDPYGITFYGGERHNHLMIDGWPIHFPFIHARAFFASSEKSNDVGLRVRMRMAKQLMKTGLFDRIAIYPGNLVPGWLPAIFTLNYEEGVHQYEGILTYPHD